MTTTRGDAVARSDCSVDLTAVAAVVFDLFGTLLHHPCAPTSSPTHALYALSPHRERLDVTRLVMLAEGPDGTEFSSGPVDLAGFLSWQRRAWRSAAEYAGVHADDQTLMLLEHIVKTRTLRLFDDVIPTLTVLRDIGVPWLICSNASPDVGYKLRRLIPDGLAPAGMVLSWRIGARKPHRRMYDALVRQLPAPPDRCLFIGDRVDCDVQAPREFGFRAELLSRDGSTPSAWHDLRPLTERPGNGR
jgi:FMN phosphatase YigB (HAD superfamily)